MAGIPGSWAAPPDLRIVGNQIETASGGCTVRLRGVNVASLEWTNTGEGPGSISVTVGGAVTTLAGIRATAAYATSVWKASALRIPLNQDRWFGCEGASAASYRQIVDDIVNIASQNNAYVILDLHWSGTQTGATAPCGTGWGNDSSTQQQNMPDDNSVTFWSDVASRYMNNPAVLFDLYNEPHNDPWSTWLQGGASGSGFHTPGLQTLLSTVRGTGANNVIVAGGLNWAYDLTGVPANPLTETGSGHGVLYAAHVYPAKPTPWDNYTTTIANNYAVIVSEFGQGSNDGGTWDNSLITWLNGTNSRSYVYSAIAWDMHTSASPDLISDWSYTPTSYHGVPVMNWLATPVPTCPNGPTPTPGSPTATFTVTSTPTATPTGTTIPGCKYVYYDGETGATNLASGSSWTSNATVSEVATSPHAGTNCLQLAYNWPSGYYAGVGWNWTHYSAGAARVTDLTQMTTLEFWVRATTGAPVTSMTVVLADTGGNHSAAVTLDTYLPGGVTGTWQIVDIPTSAFVPVSTFTNTKVWEIDWATGLGMVSGTQTVFVDDFGFYGPCPTNSPTPTNTYTFTNTRTFTPTFTNTLSPTPTTTFTYSFTPSPTNSFTSTLSPTPSFTGLPTNTPTLTPTNTATSTFTNTGTPTDSPTPTLSPTPTYTGQPTNTFTFTGTPTNSFTATFSPTLTYTGQPTATPTSTSVTVPVNLGPVSPGSSTQLPDANLPVVQFQLGNPGNNPAHITGITLTGSGTGNFPTGITTVSLYLDNNANGVVDGGDSLLATGSYLGGTLTLNPNTSIPAGSTATFLVVYQFSATAPTGTYQTQVTGAAGTNATGGLQFTGLPVTGATITLAAATSTPTPAGTNTWTPTPMATNSPTPTNILVVSPPYPNPASVGPVVLDVQGSGIVQVKWDVFTTAFRKVYSQVQASPAGHIAWDLKDMSGALVASGLYFIRIEVDSINGRKVVVKKILVIR